MQLGCKISSLVSNTHSTWSTEELTAQKIINHHNSVLRWFAVILSSSDIKFNPNN